MQCQRHPTREVLEEPLRIHEQLFFIFFVSMALSSRSSEVYIHARIHSNSSAHQHITPVSQVASLADGQSDGLAGPPDDDADGVGAVRAVRAGQGEHHVLAL